MLPAALVLAALFALLFVTRVGGARRRELLQRWPALLLAGAALFALARGAIGPAVALGLSAILAWELWPRLTFRRPPPGQNAGPADPADVEARAILGVGADATPAQIRAAYRARMARAHPDKGGSHAEAARLTAARDRLLRKRR
jgi:hypothetical protein